MSGGLSPGFREALQPLFDALAEGLGMGPLEARLSREAYAVRVAPPEVFVPVRFEVHWRRFGTVPTDLMRDAALAARRVARPSEDEADRAVFAELFVRDHVLGGGR